MITNSARFWRVVVGLSACLSTVSCFTPLPDNVPALVESRTRDIVAVIEVISIRFYERTGGFGYPMVDKDGLENFHYASDPPFRVRARVITQLYGPVLGDTITFKTHSHWGKSHLDNGNLKLVHLESDGNVLLEPDEHDANVGTDIHGRLFVPAYPDEIVILPCGTDVLKEPIVTRTPRNRFSERKEDFDEVVLALSPPEAIRKALADEKNYYSIEGKRRFPKYGILVERLAKFLQEKGPGRRDFGCWPD